MIQIIGIGIWFLIVLALQVSFIFALPSPLNALPLALMAGALIVHRAEPVYGLLWFTGCAVILPLFDTSPGTAIAFLAAAVASWILERRMFTSRSVYALIGLGVSVYALFTLIRLIFAMIFTRDVGALLNGSTYGMLFLVVGLYAAFAIARSFDSSRARFVIIRHT